MIGRGYRAALLERLIDEMRGAAKVWFATHGEVARWVAAMMRSTAPRSPRRASAARRSAARRRRRCSTRSRSTGGCSAPHGGAARAGGRRGALPDEAREEIAGIAAGASRASSNCCAVNARTEIMAGVGPDGMLGGRRAAALLAQNWDWHPDARRFDASSGSCEPGGGGSRR